ncbi:hypothetical protein SAMN06272781_8332 [Streptomyces sp. 1222.2]|nr:hypothetical protein SAMN06272781_8332 [Streptomyces sp. 1222.2]
MIRCSGPRAGRRQRGCTGFMGGARGRGGGWRADRRLDAGPLPGVPGSRLPAADVPRAGSRRRGALPGPHQSPGRPTELGGEGVSGPGGRPPLARSGLRDLPLDRPAHAHAPGGDTAVCPARARRRCLRTQTPAPLRHCDHRRRDRRADRCPARPYRPVPDRVAARAPRGPEYVCRDGSATYAEAIRRALPEAVQVSVRWHLWSNLCGRVLAEVGSRPTCTPSRTASNSTAPPLPPVSPVRATTAAPRVSTYESNGS